ncbi:MAG TPA: STAS domain-containing protein [Pseudonocardiaceae bacterium]|nr:STAS domain-containing protein [Pseudonocardiaceae bacterium]
MEFHATLHVEGASANIRLVGELDSAAAPRLNELITQAAEQEVSRLVLLMSELSYMSSAGLRCIVMAHQKLGSDVDIVLVGTTPPVAETIKLTGLHRGVIMQDPAETR